jgi:predicted transcriptional regulator
MNSEGVKSIADIVQKRFERSRYQTPAVVNADHECTSSNQNIEVGGHYLNLELV